MALEIINIMSCGAMVNTLDYESSDPSLYLGGTCSLNNRPGQSSSSTLTIKLNINRLPTHVSTLQGACFTVSCVKVIVFFDLLV